MQIYDGLMSSFTIGALDLMTEQLRLNCVTDVTFTSRFLHQETKGIFAILLFFGLLLEIYPDVMIQISFSQNSNDTDNLFSVRNIYEFTGTCVTNQTFAELYSGIVNTSDIVALNSEQLWRVISKYMAEQRSKSRSTFVNEVSTNFVIDSKIFSMLTTKS
jgi:hypothetical protein